ncbi:MAG TPA: LLM class flavin-dependent oxidoreductase, partial [Acidimicrobiales bacterium]|nr:LLM class flavin-dependent oxidoreductase [Acidimicrobiales bacterium]
RIQDLYLEGQKEEAAAAVPDALLEQTSLVGPAGYVRDRIEAYREAGVTVLNVTVIGPDALGTIEQLRGWCR